MFEARDDVVLEELRGDELPQVAYDHVGVEMPPKLPRQRIRIRGFECEVFQNRNQIVGNDPSLLPEYTRHRKVTPVSRGLWVKGLRLRVVFGDSGLGLVWGLGLGNWGQTSG
jgi:hypothetical protein